MPCPRSLLIALIVLSLVALVLAQPAIVFTPTKGQKRSEPSRAMGRRKQHAVQQAQQSLEASRKDYSSFLCSTNASACPAPVAGSSRAAVTDAAPATLADWFKIGFECLDVRTELTSCGGCQSLSQGQDCSAIPNVRVVACSSGACIVTSCADGFVVGRDAKSCVKKTVGKTGAARH